MVLILDYGMSNLRSVSKALEKLGGRVKISSDPQELQRADKVILPGVGAFGDAMIELTKRSLVTPIRNFIESGKPFFGICLGLQLLFDFSEENPGVQGMGILPGKVVRFSNAPRLKIPHMGWNQIHIKKRSCPLLSGIEDQSFVYFVHSYYVKPERSDIVLAESDYGDAFTAMVWKGNLYGSQFHPEKSQDTGLKILENFLGL